MTNAIFKHWRTSAFGMLSAVVVWWASTDFKVPTTKQEWAATIGAVLLVILGIGAHDPDKKAPSQRDKSG